MAENSGIEWTHHTWNPWVGCTKLSPACDHCYAEGWAKRAGRDVWGAHADRQRTKTWGGPVKWNKALEGTGRRERVFVASLADVFDNHKSINQAWRDDMWKLIRSCPNLDFLLLTKRPQNINRYLPQDWGDGYPNVWLGTTVENQTEANRRIPHLILVPAKVRFLSCEPLLDELNLSEFLCVDRVKLSIGYHWTEKNYQVSKLHWVIAGGESGPNYRRANPDWFRSLRDQCKAAGVPFLFKQWEGKTQKQIKALGRDLDRVVHDEYPNGAGAKENISMFICETQSRHRDETPVSSRRARIFDKIKSNVSVDPKTGCWNWQGGTSGSGRGGGYGRMWLDGQTVAVHIVMFVNQNGFIPKKMQVDHICENRICCNPDHLEIVSASENQKRKKTRELKLCLQV